jgi:hypothetical protein
MLAAAHVMGDTALAASLTASLDTAVVAEHLWWRSRGPRSALRPRNQRLLDEMQRSLCHRLRIGGAARPARMRSRARRAAGMSFMRGTRVIPTTSGSIVVGVVVGSSGGGAVAGQGGDGADGLG